MDPQPKTDTQRTVRAILAAAVAEREHYQDAAATADETAARKGAGPRVREAPVTSS